MRLWGKGEVLEYGTKEFEEFVERNGIKVIPGTRAVILVHVHQVGSSCGFSMPFYDFKAFRPTLNEFFEKRVASDEKGNWKDGIERLVFRVHPIHSHFILSFLFLFCAGREGKC